MANHHDELVDINCARCATPLKVLTADRGDARFVECEAFVTHPPFDTRQGFVVFDQPIVW
jgi:hypothetical protein